MTAPEVNRICKVDILDVPVHAITTSEFISVLLQRALLLREKPHFVCYLNAACSNIAANDREYRELLLLADCVYADGQAIVWASRALGNPLPERVNAGDFILEFCSRARDQNLKIALVGGRPNVASTAARSWMQAVPGLQIAGAWDGFFSDGGEAVVDAVAETQADILLVGMGVPLQEKWAWKFRQEFGVNVIWCVGALFEYYGEGRPRAPVWLRRWGLEWLFRLMLEPKRLWKRYLLGNTRFIYRTFRYWISRPSGN